MHRLGKTLIAAALILSAGPVMAQETIKMGALATLEGAFTVLGEDGMRGVRMALAEHGNKVAGQGH